MSAKQAVVGAAMTLAIGLGIGPRCSSDSNRKTGTAGASGSAGQSGGAGASGSTGTAGGGGNATGGSGTGTAGNGTGTGGTGTGGTGTGGRGGSGTGTGGGGGASSVACPSSEPALSAACSASNTGYCYYPGRTVCACSPSPGSPGTTVYTWGCGTAPTGCPATVPVANTTCNQAGQMCSYDFRPCAATNPSVWSCENGTWVFLAKPCS